MPAPFGDRIGVLVTTQSCGNLATHVGDIPTALANRQLLRREFNIPAEPVWLSQVHGNGVVNLSSPVVDGVVEADAAFTRVVDLPLVVMIADCLPIVLASIGGDEVAVVHAGWKGLVNGVISRAVASFSGDVVAWLGPAIGPCHYEVDLAVRQRFEDSGGFLRGTDEAHWMMDLYEIARVQLRQAGVRSITGGEACTYCDEKFFSHRRDPEAGRIALIAWIRSG
ncbi:MAG: peptidoglycan editing factor PgeF [Proteobacteria bacterium]|nr:peptidoglycan editing factor PgeF [Pseudomonadota bacterium]